MLPISYQSKGHKQRESDLLLTMRGTASPFIISESWSNCGLAQAVGEVFNVTCILMGVHYHADRHQPFKVVPIYMHSMCCACTGGTFGDGSHVCTRRSSGRVGREALRRNPGER